MFETMKPETMNKIVNKTIFASIIVEGLSANVNCTFLIIPYLTILYILYIASKTKGEGHLGSQ